MKKHSKKEIIISIVFLTWFVLSIIALLVTSSLGMPYMSLFLFGQYFAIFGAIALYGKVGMAIIHYSVGIITMSSAPIAKNYDRLSILATDLSNYQKAFIGLAIVMLILGYISLIIYFIKKKDKYFKIFIGLHLLYIIEVLYLSIR